MDSSSKSVNLPEQSMDCLFCPSDNCLNVPETFYSYNPLKSEVQYKCICNGDYNKIITINLQKFLEKSEIICHECKKIITDSDILFCKDCKNIIGINCKKSHMNNYKHLYFELIKKDNMLNHCQDHKASFIFRCMNCNKSLCNNCDLNSHNEQRHSLKQILEFIVNQRDIENIYSNFEQQKAILEKIKDINNNLIKTFENDIKIKQKIINSFNCNNADYCSIINFKNLVHSNNEKYEKILTNFLGGKEERNINENNDSKIDNFIDEILLPFYYSLMVNKDESLNDSLINCMENKINKLKLVKINNINNELFNPVDQRLNQNNNNYDNISERNKNIHNKIVTSINNFSIQGERNIDSQKFSPNKEISNNCEISNIQKEQIMENNEIIKEDKKDNNDKNIKRKLSSIKGKNKSKSKKSKEKKKINLRKKLTKTTKVKKKNIIT